MSDDRPIDNPSEEQMMAAMSRFNRPGSPEHQRRQLEALRRAEPGKTPTTAAIQLSDHPYQRQGPLMRQKQGSGDALPRTIP